MIWYRGRVSESKWNNPTQKFPQNKNILESEVQIPSVWNDILQSGQSYSKISVELNSGITNQDINLSRSRKHSLI